MQSLSIPMSDRSAIASQCLQLIPFSSVSACLQPATSTLGIRANGSVCDLSAIAVGIGQADYDAFCSLAKHRKASSDALSV